METDVSFPVNGCPKNNKILESDLRTIFLGCNKMPKVRKSKNNFLKTILSTGDHLKSPKLKWPYCCVPSGGVNKNRHISRCPQTEIMANGTEGRLQVAIIPD